MIPFDADVAVVGLFDELIGENLFGFELVAAMHYGDVGGDVGQVQGFFHRRIAAADHRHRLALVEKTIAGGASGDAAALEGFFRLQPQVHGRGAGGDDQRVAGVDAVIARQPEGGAVSSALLM